MSLADKMHCSLVRDGDDLVLTVFQPKPTITVRLTPIVAESVRRFIDADMGRDLENNFGAEPPIVVTLPPLRPEDEQDFLGREPAVSQDGIAPSSPCVDGLGSDFRHLHGDSTVESPGAAIVAQWDGAQS